MRIDKKIKSFTLVETLVSVSILTFLILAAFRMMDVGRNSWFTNNTSSELRQDIIKALSSMEKQLKKTRPSLISVSAGTSSPGLTFRLPTDIDGNGTILNSSGAIEWTAGINYLRNGSNQLVRTGTLPTLIIANNVTGLLFTRPAAPLDILQIDITVQKKSATGKIIQDTGQIIIKMRN